MKSSLVERLSAKYYNYFFKSSFYFYGAVYFAWKNSRNLLTDGCYNNR